MSLYLLKLRSSIPDFSRDVSGGWGDDNLKRVFSRNGFGNFPGKGMGGGRRSDGKRMKEDDEEDYETM